MFGIYFVVEPQSVSHYAFFVAAVPQLLLYMRLCRTRIQLCGSASKQRQNKNVSDNMSISLLAALPQNRDKQRCTI